MNLFVLCGGPGTYSGRILAHQLGLRMRRDSTISCGSIDRLNSDRAANVKYDFVLNMCDDKKFHAGCQVLNGRDIVNTVSNRRKARMKFVHRGLPAPVAIFKPDAVRASFLPLIGKTSYAIDGEEGEWTCFSLEAVEAAVVAGATHFVKLITSNREFKVHVVAPGTSLYLASTEDYKVIKVSERVSYNENDMMANPNNKSNWESFHFGALKNPNDPILKDLRATGRRVLSDLNLHWGAITFIADGDGVLNLSKIDTHIDLKVDQTNSMLRYSNAISKMLGCDPAPITRGGSRYA